MGGCVSWSDDGVLCRDASHASIELFAYPAGDACDAFYIKRL